ncbi:MAG: diguanylate cyclase [Planctomycetales bacterium]|nr:diguanylate cyclase [Planctomycetales bacterium]NIM09208.1 diguanylate cyclase [Planctomycetales bacterium]NIN08683.1 diguanylate cyclase [Planctomycetales bacterium]NIN77802.1 diguanylate cyclase [Planctomycetales bacterium]NIO34979.1 diguanylate cyclase [Planctomycetales bacterium]
MSAFVFGLWSGDFLHIPLPITVACACLVSYALGRYGWKWLRWWQAASGQKPTRIGSANDVVGHLKQLSDSIRRELRQHEKVMGDFHEKVISLGEAGLSGERSDMAGEAQAMLDSTRDLADRVAKTYDQIRKQTDELTAFSNAHEDPLTGLQNRKAMQTALKRMFTMRIRYGIAFSLLGLAVDQSGGEEVDGIGQLREQEMLRSVASLVATTARDTDLVARWESGRLMVLLPYATLEAAGMFGNRLRERIAAQLPVTVSVGVVTATDDSDPENLPKRCAEALEAAQSAGPNSLRVHDGGEGGELPFDAGSPAAVGVATLEHPFSEKD